MALAAAMLAPYTAQAVEWIEISAWSYNDVSGFVSDGLMPEVFKGVSDYMRTINRGEFCELVYSVIKKTNMIMRDNTSQKYTDCGGYPAVNKLGNMVRGQLLRSDGAEEEGELFYPEQPVTREYAGLLVQHMLAEIGIYDYYDELSDVDGEKLKGQIRDFDAVRGTGEDSTDAILLLIRDGIMTDMGDGYFHPEYEMSVEQAVTLVYRMYKAIPRIITSDNEDGAKSREIGAGLTEEITKDFYNIKSGGGSVMSLETDVYSKILAGGYGGRTLIFAVNFNDKTDVFDADTNEFLYTIPYIVNELDEKNGYAFTISNRFFPSYTGLYSMDNRELIKPEYSRREVGEIIDNGMKPPEDKYRAADGWVYYADWNEEGHMYKVDTNGGNMQRIVDDLDCTNLTYIDGTIYFNDNKDWRLHRVKEDGTAQRDISEGRGFLMDMSRYGLDPFEYGDTSAWGIDFLGFYEIYNHIYADYDYNIYKGVYADNSIMYYESEEDALCREAVFEDGSDYTEKRNGIKLFRMTENGDRIQLADFCISDNPLSALNGDGRLYFLNEEERFTTGESPIYVSDNNELKCVSGSYKAAVFGFLYDPDTETLSYDKLAFISQDEILKGTYHIIDLATGSVTQEKLIPDNDEDEYHFRDGNGRHYYEQYCNNDVSVWNQSNDDGTEGICVEYNGNTVSLGSDIVPVALDGDYLYYAKGASRVIYGASYYSRIDNNCTLVKYNYKTGGTAELGNNFNSVWQVTGSNITYQSSVGELKTTDGIDPALTVYPCKGLHRYGETAEIFHAPRTLGQKRSLYKVDTEGNLIKLTEHDSENAIYVKNSGDVRGVYE